MSDSLKSLLPVSLLKELKWNCRICRPGGSGNWPHCECHEFKPPYGGEGGYNLLGYKIELLYNHLLEISYDLNLLRTTLEAVQKVYPESFKDGVNTVFTINVSDLPGKIDLVQTTLMDGILRGSGFDKANMANLLALGSKSVAMEAVDHYCRYCDYGVVRMLMADPVVQVYRSEDPDVNEFLDEIKNEI